MSKVVTGSRAKVYVDNKLVGIFESCVVSNNTGTEAIHILGRYSPAEIVITSKEAVTVNCSGFRIVDQGKHVLPKVPKIQDLLGFQPFTITVVDRQTGKTTDTILGCVPNTDNTNYNAKASSRVNISYIGLRASDESGAQDESSGAVDLP
jgi:hypothetical protein